MVHAAPGFPEVVWHRYNGRVEEIGTGGDVHLWHVPLHEGAEGAWLFLSSEEKARARRFVAPKLAERFVAAHGALRRIVGAYVGCRPADVHFSFNKTGKPFLPGNVHFNLSHSGDVAVIGVVRGNHAIGVDIERLQPVPDALDIARRWFSPEERRWIEKNPDRRFLRCWTLREAFLKALGVGLHMPLNEFGVSPPDMAGFPFVTGHAAARHTRLAQWLFPGEAVMSAALCNTGFSFF